MKNNYCSTIYISDQKTTSPRNSIDSTWGEWKRRNGDESSDRKDTNWCVSMMSVLKLYFFKEQSETLWSMDSFHLWLVKTGIPRVIWRFVPSQMWNIVSVMSSHLMPWRLSSTLEVNDSTSITRLLSWKWSWNVNKNSDLEIWTIIFQTSISLGSMTICLGCSRATWQIFARYSAVPYYIYIYMYIIYIYQKAQLSMNVGPWIWDICTALLLRHSIKKVIYDTSTHKIPDFSEKKQESKDRSHDFTPQTSSFHWKSTWTSTAAGGNSVSGGSCWDGPSEFRRELVP